MRQNPTTLEYCSVSAHSFHLCIIDPIHFRCDSPRSPTTKGLERLALIVRGNHQVDDVQPVVQTVVERPLLDPFHQRGRGR